MNDTVSMGVGFMCGVSFMLMIVVLFPTGKMEAYNKIIEQCEQDLPRNQSCKITAVVDDE